MNADTDSHMSGQLRIELEFYQTESMYCASLNIIIQFKRQLEMFVSEIDKKTDLPVPIRLLLCQDICGSLFSNVERIYDISKEFLSAMRRKGDALKNAVDTILPIMRELYVLYISNYSRATRLLNDLKSEKLFAGFIRGCELQSIYRGLDLSSYLIMPVQRIPKYRLLLSELLRQLGDDHEDSTSLREIHTYMSNIASTTNTELSMTVMGDQRSHERIKSINTGLLNSSRKFILEGHLKKICRNGRVKLVHVLLFNDLLVYTGVSDGDLSSSLTGSYIALKKVQLNTVLLVLFPGDDPRFLLLCCDKKSLLLQAMSLREKDRWIEMLADAIAKYYKPDQIVQLQRFQNNLVALPLAMDDQIEELSSVRYSWGFNPPPSVKSVSVYIDIPDINTLKWWNDRAGVLLLTQFTARSAHTFIQVDILRPDKKLL